jgi:hypothetical protein
MARRFDWAGGTGLSTVLPRKIGKAPDAPLIRSAGGAKRAAERCRHTANLSNGISANGHVVCSQPGDEATPAANRARTGGSSKASASRCADRPLMFAVGG